MTNVINPSPFLRTSREYPEEIQPFTQEVSKSYIDIASSVNTRTIGLFPTTRPAITGESWFLIANQRQQSLRQVYTFTSTTDISIGFKISSISQFSRFSGIYTNGSSWFGLVGGTSTATPGLITFFVVVDGTSTKSDLIRFVLGAGAPALTSGSIVLEWLSQA